MTFKVSIFLLSLFAIAPIFQNSESSDVEISGSPSYSDMSETSEESDSDFSVEIELSLSDIPRIMDEPCSEEGLMFFRDIRDHIDAYVEHDSTIHDKALRYRSKCLFTFVTNLYPFWSDQEISNVLREWTDVALTRLMEYKGKKLRRQITDMSFVHGFHSLLNPYQHPKLMKKLLFLDDRDAGSSSTRGPQRIDDANAALASGRNGYCWPMQSETFVKVNELMELVLTIFFRENEKEYRHLLFDIAILNRSFNLYSLCKNIQSTVLFPDSVISLPNALQEIVNLPFIGISSEDATFARGYMDSLRKTTTDCTPRELISFTATEETVSYAENMQLRNYLIQETERTKRATIEKCQQEARPLARYTKMLMRNDCGVTVLVNSVYRVARDTHVIDLLKVGNVGQVTTILGDEQTLNSIVEQAKKTSNVLRGLSHRSYDMSNENLAKICVDFKIIYNNNYVDSLNYLIHHYPQNNLIVSMLDDDDSEVLKFYLTYLACQNLIS